MAKNTENEQSDDEQEDRRDNLLTVKEQLASLREQITILEATAEQSIELARIAAKVAFGRFKALTDAGFHPDHAFSMIIHGWGT